MTFAEGVLRLVRAGARVDSEGDRATSQSAGDRVPATAGEDAAGLLQVVAVGAPVEVALAATAEATDNYPAVEPLAVGGLSAEPSPELSPLEPGFADIEAAVALVETGLASRVVLTGFPSWPGLLWQAYQLAEAANVLILPTVIRPGGRVDIVIARDTRSDG